MNFILQFPTNVYPQNVAVDVSGEPIIRSFKFNGDKLAWVYGKIYDNETGEEILDTYAPSNGDGTTFKYNGDTVSLAALSYSSLENGKDYCHQMTLCQADENGNLIYDIFMGRGKVQSTSTGTQIFVPSDMDYIYQFDNEYYVADGQEFSGFKNPLYLNEHLAASMKIHFIGGGTYLITGYHSFGSETGLGIIALDGSVSVTEGDVFEIYSNYLTTPFYYFKCRTQPTVIVDAEGKSDGILCTATYSQAEQVSIKYYKFYLYEVVDDEDILIAESDKNYSYSLRHTFAVDYASKNFKIVCEVVTQDNVMVTANKSVEFSGVSVSYLSGISSLYYDSTSSKVHLSWNKLSNCGVRIYRIDLDTNTKLLIANTDKTYYDDYTVSNTKRYKYLFVPYFNDIIGISLMSNEIKIDTVGWYITEIEDSKSVYDNKKIFNVGNTWKFIGEIQNVTVSQNTDKVVHIGNGQFPIVSSSDTNYMSSTLNALIGYMSCDYKKWVHNIDIISDWRKFITQGKQFILKSQKGDVWVIGVSGNINTEYDESSVSVGIVTSFSFDWIEIIKADKCLFV